jgi:nitrate reductase gamma subunit
MNFLLSLFAVLLVTAAAWSAVYCEWVKLFIACAMPYIAGMLFIFGTLYRVIQYGRTPVPFRIPTTSGQQKSLAWIKSDSFESPHNSAGVMGRMFFEALFFRSLFRNTKFELAQGPVLAYGSSKFLWLGGLLFHWSFLIIILRHLRYFAEPVPIVSTLIQNIDSIFEIGLPPLFMTDVLIVVALIYLIMRRLTNPLVRYISLMSDHFPLILILSIIVSGILMRHFLKVDLFEVKKYALGLVNFSPAVPKGVGGIFYIHLFLVSALAIYLPFSKLIHFIGVFLSPTRNMANTNRMRRHINPWDYPVKVHTYEEWESEFRDKLKASGYELEKE